MPLKTRLRLEDFTLEQWINNRADELDRTDPAGAPHARYSTWKDMVGPDIEKPKAGVAGLKKTFDYRSRDAIYRLLAKMKREKPRTKKPKES